MANVFWVQGPPGCGKTSFITREVRRAAEKYGIDRIVISSFTRAAATEAAGRDTGIPRDQIGTLHSLCYKALGNPSIAETKVKEWNETCPQHLRLGQSAQWDADDPLVASGTATAADQAFRAVQLYRAKLIDPRAWPAPVQEFFTHWSDWKHAMRYLDFTDLIEMGVREMYAAPGGPRVLFIDEAQDNSPLQNALVEKWSNETETTVVVGDPDQAIYNFAGADAGYFYRAPADRKLSPRDLRHSYRLPRAVHTWAIKWISQIQERDAIAFEPRDAQGAIERCAGSFREGAAAIVNRAETQMADRHSDGDRTPSVAILASCGYQLQHIKEELRNRGLPFANPWRETRGDWNPLAHIDRILAFLRPCGEVWGQHAGTWTGPMLVKWSGMVRAEGVFKRGMKGKLKGMFGDVGRPLFSELFEVFEPNVMEDALAACERGALAALEWLRERVINPEEAKRLVYPMRVIERQGAAALLESPRICIGTGHSVKGGQADHVIMVPDLSPQGWDEWAASAERRAAIIRLFYVMATRARETLTLAAPATRRSVW